MPYATNPAHHGLLFPFSLSLSKLDQGNVSVVIIFFLILHILEGEELQLYSSPEIMPNDSQKELMNCDNGTALAWEAL